jgi:hypothetical protein
MCSAIRVEAKFSFLGPGPCPCPAEMAPPTHGGVSGHEGTVPAAADWGTVPTTTPVPTTMGRCNLHRPRRLAHRSCAGW